MIISRILLISYFFIAILIKNIRGGLNFNVPSTFTYSNKKVGSSNSISIPILALTLTKTNTDKFCITIQYNSFTIDPAARLSFNKLPLTQDHTNIYADKVVFVFKQIPLNAVTDDLLVINGIINPLFSGTYSFLIYTSNETGDVLPIYPITHDYFGTATPSVTIESLSVIPNFQISSAVGQVYSSNLLFKLNSNLNIPTSSKIYLQFSSQWESFCCPIIDSNIGNLSCSITPGYVQSGCTQSDVSTGIKQITMIVGTPIPQNTDLVITLNGLRAPPSLDTYLIDFILIVRNSLDTGTMFDQIKTQIGALTSKNSLSIGSAFYSNSVIVSSIPDTNTLNLAITLSTPVNSINYSLEIDLPLNLATAKAQNVIISGSGICNSSIISSQYDIIDQGSSIFTLKFHTAYNGLVTQQCNLQIPKVQAGPYVNYSGIVKARTYKLTVGIDEGQQQFLNFNIISDPIKRQGLSTAVVNVGAVGTYTFSFDISDPLSKNSFVIINYKETIISLASSTCSLLLCTSCTGTTAVCELDTNLKIIRLRNIFATDLTNVSSTNVVTIIVTINNVSNPKSVVTPQTSDNFIISTYYDGILTDNHLVQTTDLVKTQLIQFSAYQGLVLQTLGVTIANQIIRQNIGTLTLTFSFPNYQIMTGSYYEITFSTNSVLMGNNGGSLIATWYGSTDQLTLINWNTANNKILLQSTLAKQNNLGIVLSGDILNPYSTIRINSIILKITDSSNQLIATSSPTTGNYFVTSPDSTYPKLTIVRSGANSDQNSAIATYGFTITNPSSIAILQSYQVIITLPTLQDGTPLYVVPTSCISGSTTVSNCIFNPNDNTKVSVIVGNGPYTSQLNFQINIQNYISKQMVLFQALVTESNSAYQIYQTSVNIQNINSSLLDFTAVPSDLVSDTEVTWLITLKSITPTIDIPINSKIVIQFPIDFDPSKLVNAQIACQCSGQTINQREIQLLTTIKNMNSISISKIFNPGPYVSKSDQLLVFIRDNNNNAISDGIVDPTNNLIRYVYQCDITCRTCNSLDKTLCITCYSDKSFQNNKCVDSCDAGYYSQTGSKVCSACKNNCLTCTSDIACITCQPGFIYVPDTKQCVSSCSVLESYYLSNNNCYKCDPKCVTCTALQTCQSCSTGYYLVTGQSQCVNSSSCNLLGLYLKGNQCVACEAPCATCQLQYNQCSSCINTQDNKYLQGNQCQQQCNVGFYSDGGNKCQQCDSLCSVCSQSPRNCTECISTAGFYLNKCYSQCPDNVSLNLNGKCVSCANGCSTCSSLDKCLTCNGTYLLYKNTCVTSCPINYQMDTTQTKCVLQDITTILSRNLSESKFVPFPYLISLVLWVAIVFCSRNRAHDTFISGCVVGIGSVIEFATWITFFALQSINAQIDSQYNKLFLAALILHFLFNIVDLIFYFAFIRKDNHFIYWVSQIQNKICHGFIRFFSLVLTHKFENFIFSKFFGFSFFSAKLSSTSTFLQYNILSGLSIIFVSLPMIISAAATCYFDDVFQQMFIEGLEVIIISVFMIGFQITSIKKPKDFFLQKTADGLNPLQSHLSHIEPVPVQSRLFGTQSRTNFGGASSYRPEFSFSNRISVIGELEKPLTFGYKLNSELFHQAALGTANPNNMNMSYLNTQNAKHEITANNDYSIDLMQNKNSYKNQESSVNGSVNGQSNNQIALINPNSIHSSQELGEVFRKGKRNYETKQIAKLNTERPSAIEEQMEDDDDYGQDNLNSKLQMTGDEVNMKRVDLMNQSSNISNNQYLTMRSARSIGGGRLQQSQINQMNPYNYSNKKQPQNSSRPPSYINENSRTEKKVGNRIQNGGSKVMTPTRQNTYMQSQNQLTTNQYLQTSSPHMQNQRPPQNIYSQTSAKLTPQRSVSIGVNEQDLLESSIYPNNNQRSAIYDQKVANRPTKEQSYMSPVRTLQNTREMNFQNHISARSRSRSASPQRPVNTNNDEDIYKKMNHLRSKSRDRLDFDEEDHPQYLEGNIDRLKNGQYQTKNPNHLNKFNGGVISPEESPDKNEFQTFDDQSHFNSKIGTNLDELDMLKQPSYFKNKTNQTIEKVGSQETENEDNLTPQQKVSHLNSQLFYLSNPMERPVGTPSVDNRQVPSENKKQQQQQPQQIQQPMRKLSGENKEDSSRVQQMQTKVENLDTNEFDPYGLNAEATEKARKMRRPSAPSAQNTVFDRRSLIKKQLESDDDHQSNIQDLDSQRLDESSSDQPPVINHHRMVGPPIIPGETIQSNNSPPKQLFKDPLGTISQKQFKDSQNTSIRASQADGENKNLIKPLLRPQSNNYSGGKYSRNDSEDEEVDVDVDDEDDENILQKMNQKRSIEENRNISYEPDQNKEQYERGNKMKSLLIRQNEASSQSIEQENQIEQAGRMALDQIRVVTPMTTMINPREFQKMELANKNNQPLRNSQQNQQTDNNLDDNNFIQKSKELDNEFNQQREKLSQIVNTDQFGDQLQRKPTNNSAGNGQQQQKENIRQSNQFRNDVQPIMSHDVNQSPNNIENEKVQSKGQSIRGSYQMNPSYHIKSQNNHNESFNKYTDVSATKTENFDYHPLNLDEFGQGGMYSHQQSMNLIPNQASNTMGVPQIFRDNSTISAIVPQSNQTNNQNAFNLRNPSTGELNNNYFGLSAKEYEEYNQNNPNNIKKHSPTSSRIANQYYNQNPIDNKSRHQRRDVDDIYDSQESIRTASEAQMDFNEISPSDFNVLNQRYEEDLVVEDQQKSQVQQKALSQTPSYYNVANDQDDKLINSSLNKLRNHQQNDSHLPSHIRNSRKSENILSIVQNDGIQRGLHAHSNANSIASINQQHHNFMQQNHPMIITSNNQRQPTENGTKRDNMGFHDNIRHLSDSRSVSYNGNIGNTNENNTPGYHHNQQPSQNNHNTSTNSYLHYNLKQQPSTSFPTHQNINTAGDDDSYIDLAYDDHDQNGKKINPQLNRNISGGQSSSYIPQDSGNRNNNQKTPQKQDPLEKLKNLEKIYLSKIENSINNTKSNNSLQKKVGKRTPQASNSKPKNNGFIPNRQAKDTNDALFLDDKNDYQDIDF